MFRDYAPLPSFRLHSGTRFAEPSQSLPTRVTVDTPALEVMTDLSCVSAVVARPHETIDEAHRRMIQRKVHLLLVIEEDHTIVGVITSTDLAGEKPMQAVGAKGIKRSEVLVRDIMTRQGQLEVLSLEQIRCAKVGHIVATLLETGRQHAMVVESDKQNRQMVRGLFSANQIARQLGIEIRPNEVARTFSEVEVALTH